MRNIIRKKQIINGSLVANTIILTAFILIYLFLTLFSSLLHNHDLLEGENFDCPLYLFSNIYLMTTLLVFTLLILFSTLLWKLISGKPFIYSFFQSLPSNKSPPLIPVH